MNGSEIIVTVKNPLVWILSQIGQIVLGVFLISLAFNYAYRFLVDWNVQSVWFYSATVFLGLITMIVFRRDYIFAKRYVFSSKNISITTLFGVVKNYPTDRYKFIPVLSKGVNIPEGNANLSFKIADIENGKPTRSYSWWGFSKDDFKNVSQLYGYSGELDFKMRDFGRQ